LLLASCGCATARFDPTLLREERFALVALHAAEQIPIADSVLAGAGDKQNQWGRGVIAALDEAFTERLEKIIAHPLLPRAQVAAHPSYRALQGALDGVPQASVAGLRPLGLDREAWLPLGRFALELEQDAVLAVQLHLSLEATVDQPKLVASMELLIVGRDGRRQFGEVFHAESMLDDPGPDATPLEHLSINPTGVEHAAFRAVMSCLDRFQDRWRSPP
jgi:hypothetical protein